MIPLGLALLAILGFYFERKTIIEKFIKAGATDLATAIDPADIKVRRIWMFSYLERTNVLVKAKSNTFYVNTGKVRV